MKKLTFEEAKMRFEKKRNDIILCEENYKTWKKNAIFFDLIENDFFIAIPKNVYVQNSCHPKRAVENRKNTNLEKYGYTSNLYHPDTQKKIKEGFLEKYGTENLFQSEIIKDKIKNSNLEKYGVENVSQIEDIKEKKKETFINRYGVNNPFEIDDVIKKVKNNNIEKYGTEHPMQSDEIKLKTKNTMITNYGVKSPFQLPGVYEKSKKTCLDRYGVENFWAKNRKNIIELNTPLCEWYKQLSNPKPQYENICKQFIGITEIHYNDLESLIDDFKKNINNNKTKLEIFTENLLKITHFNKFPGNLKYRPDFKLSDSIYMNVDGLYWHSEKQKENNYHFNMRKEFEKCNLRLFQFHENEIYTKPLIVKSIIDNALGNTSNKTYARKCIIKPVLQSVANDFLESNHLMGKTMAKHIGLYDIRDNTKLLAIMSYKIQKDICKIERFCSLIEYNIAGGFSKLLSYIEKNCLNTSVRQIYNWVDLRYGNGIHLLSKSFQVAKETQGWKWSDGTSTFNRLKCRANMDNRKLSEKEHANELGWYKLYDAGQRLYIKKL